MIEKVEIRNKTANLTDINLKSRSFIKMSWQFRNGINPNTEFHKLLNTDWEGVDDILEPHLLPSPKLSYFAPIGESFLKGI